MVGTVTNENTWSQIEGSALLNVMEVRVLTKWGRKS